MEALYGALPLIPLQIYVLICAVNEALCEHHKVIYIIMLYLKNASGWWILLHIVMDFKVHSYKAFCIASCEHRSDLRHLIPKAGIHPDMKLPWILLQLHCNRLPSIRCTVRCDIQRAVRDVIVTVFAELRVWTP